MRITKLLEASRKIFKDILNAKKGETLVILADENKKDIIKNLSVAADEMGLDFVILYLPEVLRPIVHPKKTILKILNDIDIFICMIDYFQKENSFRETIINKALKSGRAVILPNITRDTMERVVNINYEELLEFNRKIMNYIANAKNVYVENPYGTEVEFLLKDKWNTDFKRVEKKGDSLILPVGEIYSSPQENSVSGRVVISQIFNKVGRGEIYFEKGKIVKWRGREVSFVLRDIKKIIKELNVGEFGIGANPGAKLSKNILEAEKALGTVHFIIGVAKNTADKVSKKQYELLIEKPTVFVDGKQIIKNGKIVVEL